MKKIKLVVLISFAFIQINAQYIQRSVIGSAGMVTTVGNVQLSSTTGEAITQSLSNSNYRITQGFQQGKKIDSTGLYLILYLEGFYAGGYLMRPALYNQGRSLDLTIADTITIELHPALSPLFVEAHVKTLLHTNGNADCKIPVAYGNYYVVIKHRNNVETWSANPIAFTGTFAGYDFSYAANTAYGNNQVEVEPGIFALHSGDINQDENVDLLDASLLETDINNFQFGYFATDINGDGNVDLLDAPIVESNINGFVFSSHP